MQNVSRKLDKAGKKMQKFGKKLSVGLTLPLLALGAASVNAFDKQAKAIAQVEAGLKSTQGQVGKTSAELQKMASDLQNKTIFGDEEILKDATSQLLTFTNIAGKQFERTQLAALDLATRLNGDLKSASIQLGKALNDPVANLSALSRSGIQFSKSQKQTINALVKTNRLADAQTIILNELEKQYGGSAAAAAKAGKGGLTQLGNILGDVTEDFGKIIVEGIQPFVEKVKEIALSIKRLSPETKKWIVVIGGLLAALGPVIVITGTLIRNLAAIIPLVKALTVAIAANPIGAFAVAITALAGGLLLANSRLTPLTNATKEFNNLTITATSSIAKQKAQLEKYLSVAKDDKRTKEDRQKAIKSLNNLSKQYLGDLTLEKINTDSATVATEKYVNALLTKAKVIAAEEKLVEVQKKLLDLQLATTDAVDPSIWQTLVNSGKAVGNVANFAKRQGDTVAKNYGIQKTELEKLNAQLISFISTNEAFKISLSGNNDNKILPPDIPTGDFDGFGIGEDEPEPIDFEDLLNTAGLRTALVIANAEVESFMGGIAATVDLDVEKIGESFDNLKTRTIEFSEEFSSLVQNGLGASIDVFGEFIGKLVTGGASIGGLFKGLLGVVASFIGQLGKSLVAAGLASQAFKKLFAKPGAAIAIGASLIILSKVVGKLLQSGPKDAGAFANGGVIGGSSFYGDKLLARVNSGELVLNQDQQKSLYNLIEPSVVDQPIILNGGFKLTGDTLQLMIDRALDKRNRRS